MIRLRAAQLSSVVVSAVLWTGGARAQSEDGIPVDVPPGDEYSDTDPSALTDFRAALDPYGSWQEDPTYGTVWVPSENVVGSDFSPYVTGGQWAYGDDYVWMSDYAWGWAPFHYGRWAYLNDRGWGWIPGRQYAGAWVSWRVGEGGYVGWGAMPPTWGWRNGAAVGIGAVPPAAYSFTHTSQLFSPSVGEHVLSGPQVAGIAAHTQPYVPATPGVHTAASPGVVGPPPSTSLHLNDSQIAHVPAGDRGLMRAQQFAHPSGAQLAGAHAPASFGQPRYAASSGARTFPGGAVAGHALIRPAYGNYTTRMGTTRIGGGAPGASYSSSVGRYEGSRGGQSYSYGGAFHGGAAYSGGAYRPSGGAVSAPPANHYYPSTGGGATGGGGGHYGGGGHGGGGHGGGGHR